MALAGMEGWGWLALAEQGWYTGTSSKDVHHSPGGPQALLLKG